jgi:ribonuclease P protein component
MRSKGFPRDARLLSKPEFDAAFGGVRRHSDWFTAHVRPTPGARARLGLAVSRRVAKRAVDRNRLKRLVREHFRQVAVALPPFDLVVTAKPGAAAATRAALHADLTRLFGRVAALKPEGPAGTIPASKTSSPTLPPGASSPD